MSYFQTEIIVERTFSGIFKKEDVFFMYATFVDAGCSFGV